jgi:predicted nucleic acid-binding protein
MPNFLADTSFLIDIINDRNGRREFLRELLQPGDAIGCCTINWIEIYTGMRPGAPDDRENRKYPPHTEPPPRHALGRMPTSSGLHLFTS